MIWSPGMTLKDVERDTIKAAHKYFGGNNTATAAALGIGARTLYDKLKDYESEEIQELDRAYDLRRSEDEFLQRQRYGNNPPPATDDALPEPLAEKVSDDESGDYDSGSLDTSDIPPVESASEEETGDSEERISEESTFVLAAEHPVSLPKREEVQTVLSRKTALSGERRAR